MFVIINRDTTTCGSCGRVVTIEHRQIACRELTRLGYGPATGGVVGAEEKAVAKAVRRLRAKGLRPAPATGDNR
jgi:hypothetical protein